MKIKNKNAEKDTPKQEPEDGIMVRHVEVCCVGCCSNFKIPINWPYTPYCSNACKPKEEQEEQEEPAKPDWIAILEKLEALENAIREEMSKELR